MADNVTSLEPFLNRRVLFVHGLPSDAGRNEIRDFLQEACDIRKGRVEPLFGPDGICRGSAFLNFYTLEDASWAVEHFRFGWCFPGRPDLRPMKVFYASDRAYKDLVQGPPAAKFKIVVNNFTEDDADEPELFKIFSRFGEILQCHLDYDDYGQLYFIVQYINLSSVTAACNSAKSLRLGNAILHVEPFKKPGATGVRSMAPPPHFNGDAFPALGATGPSASAGASAAASVVSGGGGGIQPATGMTYAALQQQQEEEERRQQRQAELRAQQQQAAAAAAALHQQQRTSSAQQQQQHSYYNPPGTSYNPSLAGLDLYGRSASAAEPAQPQAPPPMPMPIPLPMPYPSVQGYHAAQQQQQQQQQEAAAAAAAAAVAAAQPPKPPSTRAALGTALTQMDHLHEVLCCPITTEPMRDPVIAADGHTYERFAIESWLATRDTSPMTNEALPHKQLLPNKLAKTIIEECGALWEQ